MKKKDLLRLIESIPDGNDIVFLDDEGNYGDSIEFIESRILGRFRHRRFPEITFYATYQHYDTWEFLHETPCTILG